MLNWKKLNFNRGRNFLTPLLNLEEFEIPTIVILDENFNQKGLFLEQPKTAKKLEDTAENELFYLEGNFLTDTARELVQLIKK